MVVVVVPAVLAVLAVFSLVLSLTAAAAFRAPAVKRPLDRLHPQLLRRRVRRLT